LSVLQGFFRKTLEKVGVPLESTSTGAILTPSNIRIISLEESGEKVLLTHFFDVKPDAELYSEQTVERLNQACKEQGLISKTVCNLITDKEFFIRHIEMPPMPFEEVIQSLRFSEKDAIPFPAETAVFDAMVFPGEAEDEDMSVLYAALDSNVAEKYHHFFKKSILKHVGISTVPSTLLAIMKKSEFIDKSRPVPFINISGTISGIYIFSGDDLKFTRDIHVGGLHITKALATDYTVGGKKVSLNMSEADGLKDTFGIPAEKDFDTAGMKGVTGRLVFEKVEPVLDKMVMEYGRSLDYFKNENRLEDIPRVYLIGNNAHLDRLPEYLSEKLGYKFVAYNPFRDFLEVESENLEHLEKEGAGLVVAVGLALDRGRHINLLPEKLRYSVRKFVQKIIPYAGAVLVIFFAMALYLAGIFYEKVLESQVAVLSSQVSALKAQEQRIKFLEMESIKVRNRIKAIDAKISVSPDIKGKNIAWPNLINSIAELLPDDIALTKIQISFSNPSRYATDGKQYNQQVMLEGKVRGRPEQQIKALRELLSKMKASDNFTHVSLISSEQKEFKQKGRTRLVFLIAADIKESSA
jgi:type IV pilus assembly protein PilM